VVFTRAWLIAPIVLLVLGGSWSPTFAQGNGITTSAELRLKALPEKIKLDGIEYSREQIIRDFSSIAFSSHPPVPDQYPERTLLDPFQAGERSLLRQEKFKEEYLWLYEFVFREHGFPNYFSINKWVRPITISLNYPFKLNPKRPMKGRAFNSYSDYPRIDENGSIIQEPYLFDRTVSLKNSRIDKLAENIVRDMAPQLTRLTGLPVSYLPPETETEDSYGHIRIIFVDDIDFWPTRFKMGDNTPQLFGSNPGVEFRNVVVQYALPSAVHFTPYADRQVDGFFLSNENNEIEMSFCYIWHRHPQTLIETLLKECLVRSLGLPDAPRGSPHALFGLWNNAEKKNSASIPPLKTSAQITDYDSYMIGLLYTQEIRPGMSTMDVFRAFSN
jgi:hypothetical protein